ncbi:GGDEF domain-containing protein [Litorisediminicola beolgyonensis]|uniref:GGDEF domain-containing protein n=1 Tax=Litorisediminicola beolgyonensis TaxID=1173614 RepID=A0ABW3ZKR9_9RHOB
MSTPCPLDTLCPMHLDLSPDGGICHVGPTMARVLDGLSWHHRPVLELIHVDRPRGLDAFSDLVQQSGRKLRLRLRADEVRLSGVLVRKPCGGAIIDCSFGIGVGEAVARYGLSGRDFAPTDLSVEFLFLQEAKSAAMSASRRLNRRLQSARILAETQAFTDTLTGLGNRRALDQALDRLTHEGRPFALMQIDLDLFKAVNDSLGHGAGDAVLQAVAERIDAIVRSGDTAARVGGDEFVLIFPGLADAARLERIAARLIAAIEEPVFHDRQACRVSASIGIACSEHCATTGIAPLEAADRALYDAKHAGRGRAAFAKGHGSLAEPAVLKEP